MPPRKAPTDPEDLPEPPPVTETDPFIAKLESSMLWMLGQPLDHKDRNALFANCIRFLTLKYKIEGTDDGGSFFGSD